jgi:hypothetical protein
MPKHRILEKVFSCNQYGADQSFLKPDHQPLSLITIVMDGGIGKYCLWHKYSWAKGKSKLTGMQVIVKTIMVWILGQRYPIPLSK